ncbi:hypothetical protein PENSUB_9828 [Penicillium subrubescens]|uniref:Uncharacterized protein n=1 Tax=Penicillium subrubescens TaxID=1316194 RepID=A0A1Q5TCF5_9EURO|nr:hypothetical protein PENSUB_9828 [Penicillium subrubescens]
MLRRAKKLQPIFDTFCSEFHHTHLRVTSDKWRQIDYLICITQPFYKFTTALSKTKDVTIHTVFSIYNRLFDHLENRIRQLQRKKIGWKQQMLKALRSAESKLRDYYTITDLEGLSDIYSTGTILAPQYKLEFFQTPDWQDNKKDFAARYKQSLEDRVKHYEDSVYSSLSRAGGIQSAKPTSEIDLLLARDSRPTAPVSELTQYLKSGK